MSRAITMSISCATVGVQVGLAAKYESPWMWGMAAALALHTLCLWIAVAPAAVGAEATAPGLQSKDVG